MKRARFTEEQIIVGVLREHEAGAQDRWSRGAQARRVGSDAVCLEDQVRRHGRLADYFKPALAGMKCTPQTASRMGLWRQRLGASTTATGRAGNE